MKIATFLTGFSVLLFGVLLLAGCGNDNHDSIAGNPTGSISIASVYPADGSASVATTTPVAVTFTGPVDTLTVMQNLHLAGGQAMHEWRDSLSHYGGFGMMSMNMGDHMMNWMDSIQTPGDFHWNETMDSCEFVPNTALTGNTEYLCLIYEGGMHDNHGGMMGGANHNDSGYHMYGFTTGP